MFSLGIHYLNGWAMAAADGAKKEVAEWPPHPGRVFMALAAAWFETDQDQLEGEALRWLESLPEPPEVAASGAEYRKTVISYVPINDAEVSKIKVEKLRNKVNGKLEEFKEAGLLLLAEHRLRQPRSFPVAIPHNPVVHIIWKDDLPDQHRLALIALSRKVTSIGHSASLVQMWVEDQSPKADWVLSDGIADAKMRVPCRGRLSYLEDRYNRSNVVRYRDLVNAQNTVENTKKTLDAERKRNSNELKGTDKKRADAPYKERIALIDTELDRIKQELEAFGSKEPKSLRPDEPGVWQGYRRVKDSGAESQPEALYSVFDPNLIILKLTGKRLGLHSTLRLTQALRGALLKDRVQPLPEWLCGHTLDGASSLSPHIALLPMPFVGAEHADGRILGVALALPGNVDKQEAAQLLEPWLRDAEDWQPRKIKLFDGQWLECTAELDIRESPPWSLKSDTCTRRCEVWASVTPVVLDRHFDGPDKWEKVAESVKDACERIGLPRPVDVLLHPVSMFEGVPRSNEFPYMIRKKDGGRLHHAHAVIRFDENVRGPVLIGAGRFRGYGLCRPLLAQGEKNHV